MKKLELRALALVAGLTLFVAGAQGAPDKPLLGASVQAEIVEVHAKNVVKLDRGADAGVKDHQVFEIYQNAKAYALPLSGGAIKMRVDRTIVGHAVVFEVHPDHALAHAYDVGEKKLETHLVAVLNQGLNAPPLPPRVRACVPAHPAPASQAAWRKVIPISLDVDLEPGRRAYYEWRAPAGGTFTNGVEVAPGVFRTTAPEIGWIVPVQAKVYPINVTVTDSTGQSFPYQLRLESLGARQERAASPHVLRTLFSKMKFEGLRDVAFDQRNNFFWLDGTPGTLSGHEYLHGMNADGIDLGAPAEVKPGNYSALAVNDDYFYFIDQKETCVKRFARGGALSAILAGEATKIGESGSGNGRFRNPVDLALLPDGGVAVLDQDQRCVQRFDSDGRFVDSFGKGGEGDHELKDPVALAASQDGTVYVLDNGRKRVVIYKNGRTDKDDIEVGTANEDLRGLAVDDYGSALAVLERGSGSVKIFAQTREGWTGTFKSATAPQEDVAFLKKPVRLRMDATRLAYVIDRDGESLARFDAAEHADFVARIGTTELSDDVRLAASGDSDVVALDRGKKVAYRFDRLGWTTAKMGFESPQGGELKTPVGVGVDADGSVYVADAKKVEVERYQAKGGAWLRAFGSEAVFHKIRYGQMSSHREKFIVLMAGDNPQVGVLDPQTADLVPYPANDAEDVELATFSGRFAAPKDEPGFFWIVDKSGERVSRFGVGDSKAPVAITQDFKKVTGIAASPAGAVFLCDRKAKTIEVYTGNGVKLGTVSDEQLAPADVATDDLGRLYVFDAERGRIVELGE